MDDEAQGPERPRSRRVRNAVILAVLMVGISLGVGILVGGAIEDERAERRAAEAGERRACETERQSVEAAIEAGRAQTGRILGLRELQFIGLLPELPRHHILGLEGDPAAPMDYTLWATGRCEEVAGR